MTELVFGPVKKKNSNCSPVTLENELSIFLEMDATMHEQNTNSNSNLKLFTFVIQDNFFINHCFSVNRKQQ